MQRSDPFTSPSRAGPLARRNFMAGAAALGLVAPSACQSYPQVSFTEAIRRLLVRSSEQAFLRLTEPGGVWDDSVAQLGLAEYLGTRGDVLSTILASSLFKNRLEDAVARYAVDASYRAAPIVADTVRTIGIGNAMALVRGGPTAATTYLRDRMGMALVEAMVPELYDALRMAEDPLMSQMLSALTGVDVPQVARNLSMQVNDVIWREIAREEAGIRADPRATRDPLLIGVFGAESF